MRNNLKKKQNSIPNIRDSLKKKMNLIALHIHKFKIKHSDTV